MGDRPDQGLRAYPELRDIYVIPAGREPLRDLPRGIPRVSGPNRRMSDERLANRAPARRDLVRKRVKAIGDESMRKVGILSHGDFVDT